MSWCEPEALGDTGDKWTYLAKHTKCAHTHKSNSSAAMTQFNRWSELSLLNTHKLQDGHISADAGRTILQVEGDGLCGFLSCCPHMLLPFIWLSSEGKGKNNSLIAKLTITTRVQWSCQCQSSGMKTFLCYAFLSPAVWHSSWIIKQYCCKA